MAECSRRLSGADGQAGSLQVLYHPVLEAGNFVLDLIPLLESSELFSLADDVIGAQC
jgi:hypothetical protein